MKQCHDRLLIFLSKLVILLIFMPFLSMVRDCSNIYVEKSKLDIIMEEVTCTMFISSAHFVAQMNVPYPKVCTHDLCMPISLKHFIIHTSIFFLIPNSSTYGYKILCKTLMLLLVHSFLPCSLLVLLYFSQIFFRVLK